MKFISYRVEGGNTRRTRRTLADIQFEQGFREMYTQERAWNYPTTNINSILFDRIHNYFIPIIIDTGDTLSNKNIFGIPQKTNIQTRARAQKKQKQSKTQYSFKYKAPHPIIARKIEDLPLGATTHTTGGAIKKSRKSRSSVKSRRSASFSRVEARRRKSKSSPPSSRPTRRSRRDSKAKARRNSSDSKTKTKAKTSRSDSKTKTKARRNRSDSKTKAKTSRSDSKTKTKARRNRSDSKTKARASRSDSKTKARARVSRNNVRSDWTESEESAVLSAVKMLNNKYKSEVYQIIPQGEEINVAGVERTNLSIVPLNPANGGNSVDDIYIGNNMEKDQIIRSGIYGADFKSQVLLDMFIPNFSGSVENIHIFKDEKNTNIYLQNILDVLKIVNNNYYQEVWEAIFTQIESNIKLNKLKSTTIPQILHTREQLPATTSKIIKYIEKAVEARLGYDNMYQILNNMNNISSQIISFYPEIGTFNNLLDHYYKLFLTGNKDIMKDILIQVEEINSQRLQKRKKEKDMKNVIEKEKHSLSKFNKNYKQLTNAEKKIIDGQQLKNMSNERQDAGLYKAIREQNIVELKKEVQRLEKIIKIPSTSTHSDFIKNKKGQQIICPHIWDKANLTIKQSKNKSNQINETTPDQIILANYGILLNSNRYCKICGELLMKVEEQNVSKFSKDEYSVENQYDYLYSQVYREVRAIVNRFIILKENTSQKSEIIQNITLSIKEKIYEINTSLYKIKTIETKTIQLVTEIYIAIYTFAALVQLIIANSKEIDFIPERRSGSPYITYGGKDKTSLSKMKLKNTIEKGLAFVKQYKKLDIIQSNLIEMNNIKTLFLASYKWIMGIQYTNIDVDNIQFFIQNETFNYAIKVHKLAGLLPEDQMYISRLHSARGSPVDFMKTISSRDYNTIEKEMKARPNEEGTLPRSIFWGLKPIDMEKSKTHKWINKNYNAFLKIIHQADKNLNSEGLNLSKVLDMRDAGNPLINIQSINYTELYEPDIQKILEELRQEEEQRYLQYKIKNIRSIEYAPAEIFPYPENKNLQCPSGSKITSIMYKKINKYGEMVGKSKLITPQTIKEWIESNNKNRLKSFNDMKVYKFICSKTNIEKKFINIDNFHNFYRAKCPQAILNLKADQAKYQESSTNLIHRYNTNGVCTLCEMKRNQINNKQYEKYKGKHNQILKKIKQYHIYSLTPKQTQNYTSKTKTIKLKKNITLNVRELESLAKLLKVNSVAISNIGFYEGKELEEVSCKDISKCSIKNIDNKSNQIIIKRNNQLYNYILFLLRNYNQLKFLGVNYIAPQFLTKIYKKYIQKYLEKLTTMPAIEEKFTDQYNKEIKILRFTGNRENIIQETNFLFNSFVRIMKIILNNVSKINKEFGLKYIEALFCKILNSEKKLTKFEVSRYKESVQTEIEERLDDFDNVLNDKQLAEEADEDAQKDTNEEEESTNNPFSLEDLDVEDSDDDSGDSFNIRNDD
jgi:hypothetical protein